MGGFRGTRGWGLTICFMGGLEVLGAPPWNILGCPLGFGGSPPSVLGLVGGVGWLLHPQDFWEFRNWSLLNPGMILWEFLGWEFWDLGPSGMILWEF